MSNLDKPTLQKAIKNSKDIYNRDGSLGVLLREYMDRQVLVDSAEGREIQKIADGSLNMAELQRTYSILERGLKQSLARLKRGIKLDESLGNIQDVISGRLALLRKEGNIQNGSPRHRAYIALEAAQDLLGTLNGEEIIKYQLLVGASRYNLVGPKGVYFPPVIGNIDLTPPTHFQTISAYLDSYTGIDLESVAEIVTSAVPGIRTYRRNTLQSRDNPDEKLDINDDVYSLVEESLQLAQLDMSSYENEDRVNEIITRMSLAEIDFIDMSAYIRTLGTQPTKTGINTEYLAGSKSTWGGSPFDKFEDLFDIETFTTEGEIGEKLLELQTDKRDDFDPSLMQDITSLADNIHIEIGTQFEKSKAENVISEMRKGVDGNKIDSAKKTEFMNNMEPLFKAELRLLSEDLKEQLNELEGMTPEKYSEGWDPYIRLGEGVDNNGNPISVQGFGPYLNPKEKAIAIVTLLVFFDAAEKDGQIFLSILWDNWFIDTGVALIPGDWSDSTLMQLWIMERFYAFLFGGINRMRASRGNIGSTLGRIASRIPMIGSKESQGSEEVEKTIADRQKQVEELQRLLEDLGIHKGKIKTELARIMEENPKGLFNYATIFNDTLFYSDLHGIINGKGRGVIFTGGLTGRRAFAHYRFMELINMDVQSSLSFGTPNGDIVPFTGDNDQFRSRRIPVIGTEIPYTENRFLGVRTGDAGAVPMRHFNPLEAARFTEQGVWANSPLSYHRSSISPQNKIESILERYKKANKLFEQIKGFEKYRLDVNDDSGLQKLEAEVDEMKRQFLKGNIVELNVSRDPIYDANGKLKFIKNTRTLDGDEIVDFEKYLKESIEASSPKFTLEYGKILEADRISDTERTTGSITEDLKKAETYAETIPDEKIRQGTLTKIGRLKARLQQQGETPEGATTVLYSDHMTKTEFYTRLELALVNDPNYNKSLDIDNKSDFEAKKLEIKEALGGNNSGHTLAKLGDTGANERAKRAQFDWFDDAQNEKTNSDSRKLVERVQLHAQILGHTDFAVDMGELLADSSRAQRVVDGEQIQTLEDFKKYIEAQSARTGSSYDISTLKSKTALETEWKRIRFDWFHEDGKTVNEASTSRELVDKAILQARVEGGPTSDARITQLESLKANADKVWSLGVTRNTDFIAKLGSTPFNVPDIRSIADTPLATLERDWEERRFNWFSMGENQNKTPDENSSNKRLFTNIRLQAEIEGNNKDLLNQLDDLEAEISVNKDKFKTTAEFEKYLVDNLKVVDRLAKISSLDEAKKLSPKSIEKEVEEVRAEVFDPKADFNIGIREEPNGKGYIVWENLMMHASIEGDEEAIKKLLQIEKSLSTFGEGITKMSELSDKFKAELPSLGLEEFEFKGIRNPALERNYRNRTIHVGVDKEEFILMGGSDEDVAELKSQFKEEVERYTSTLPKTGKDGKALLTDHSGERPLEGSGSKRTQTDILNGLLRETQFSSIKKLIKAVK